MDAFYFVVVTLCTIGYGDTVPDSTFTKLFSCFVILVGFRFIDILLNGLVTHIYQSVLGLDSSGWLHCYKDIYGAFSGEVELG